MNTPNHIHQIGGDCCKYRGTFQFPKTNRLKRAAVIIITRIARCWDKTDPAPLFVGGIGFVIGAMITVLSDVTKIHPSSLIVGLLHATWTGLWFMFLFEAVLYGMWEMVQGFKWLGQWAASHKD